MNLKQSGNLPATRSYQKEETKRPYTRSDLADDIAAKIHALYLPYIIQSISESKNEHILLEVEKIIKKIQADSGVPKTARRKR